MCSGLVQLIQSPRVVYAECGKEVLLKCEVSSPQDGLSVKFMGWSLDGKSMCSVNTEGNLVINHTHSLSSFHCHYSHGQLVLRIHNMQPQDAGSSTYACKLRSNMGTAHKNTTVLLKGQFTLDVYHEIRNNMVMSVLLIFIQCFTSHYLHKFVFSSSQNQTSAYSLSARVEKVWLKHQNHSSSGTELDQSDPSGHCGVFFHYLLSYSNTYNYTNYCSVRWEFYEPAYCRVRVTLKGLNHHIKTKNKTKFKSF